MNALLSFFQDPATSLFLNTLADGFFAAVAAIGFALISNPPVRVALIAGLLAAVGHMFRYVLLHTQAMGISSASLCAAMLITLLAIAAARRWHTPAEMYAFPALLPMIPGMFAYKAILATMQFLGATDLAEQQRLLTEMAYNGFTSFFIMSALAVGAMLPLFLLHRESALMRGIYSRWRERRGNARP